MTIKELAKKYSVRLLVQFGSTVEGKTHQESDVDIAYLSAKKLGIMEEGRLILDLAQTLKIPIEKIDLGNIKGASSLFLKQIFDKGRPLYEIESSLFNEYQIYAYKRFFEDKPIYEFEAKLSDKKLKYLLKPDNA